MRALCTQKELSNEVVSHREADLVDADNSISDVVQGDLAITIHIQNVKGLLRLLMIQKVFQVFWQDVCPAEQPTTLLTDHHL